MARQGDGDALMEGIFAPGSPSRGIEAMDTVVPILSDLDRPYNEDEFWFAAGGDNEPGQAEFEQEWADMRSLIDVDSLMDGQT